jgi:hypothetical protein
MSIAPDFAAAVARRAWRLNNIELALINLTATVAWVTAWKESCHNLSPTCQVIDWDNRATRKLQQMTREIQLKVHNESQMARDSF